MSAGDRVHKLHCDAETGTCLAQAAFQYVASPQFLSGGPHIDCTLGIAQRGTVRDDFQVRKARQASYDFFRQSFGGYLFAFDFDGDGSVSASDFIQFRLRFGGSI